jgi:pyruvate/2-oxoglutarate dehydrogenase complex dihydrolipoamide dehydrogenase (E3) component
MRAAWRRPVRGGEAPPYDVAVIGAGMGGWAGVRAARRRGMRVVLFESGPVGGT